MAGAVSALYESVKGTTQQNLAEQLIKERTEKEKGTFYSLIQGVDSITLPKNSGKDVKLSRVVPIFSNLNQREIIKKSADKLKGSNINAIAFGQNGNKVARDKFFYESALPSANAKRKDSSGDPVNGATKYFQPFDKDTILNPGNLFGATTNIASIIKNTPTLREEGGQVNRVQIGTVMTSSKIKDIGIYSNFTQELLDHGYNKDYVNDARTKMAEAMGYLIEQDCYVTILSQLNISNSNILYGGSKNMASDIKINTMGKVDTGETADANDGIADDYLSVVTYNDFVLQDLLQSFSGAEYYSGNMFGSPNYNTSPVGKSRICVIPPIISEHIRTGLKDPNNNNPFIAVERYAGSEKNVIPGEIGMVGQYRIVVSERMPRFNGCGAVIPAGGSKYYTGGTTQYSSSINYATAYTPPDNGSTAIDFTASTGIDKERFDVVALLMFDKNAIKKITFGSSAYAPLNTNVRMPGLQSVENGEPYGVMGIISMSTKVGIHINRPDYMGAIYTMVPIG